MKITKLGHSCLLVEMPEPVNRTVLFDPGVYSEEYVNVDKLLWCDDIVITHEHPDHMSVGLIKKIVTKFPDVRILATTEATEKLKSAGIKAITEPPEGFKLFNSPHEDVSPIIETPTQIGVHYLDSLTHPGDSHSFSETKAILALPVQAPWGSMVNAIRLGLKLKPEYIIPIHDWHWSDEAKKQMYNILERAFAEHDIKLLGLANGEPAVIEL
jgi:L-ascorbate metabolism protein UlaG (beta-lactamase superfamily)